MVHFIEDIFWNMGFKHEAQAEQVIRILFIICIGHIVFIILIILIIFIILRLQVRCNLGIADHIWKDQRRIDSSSESGN